MTEVQKTKIDTSKFGEYLRNLPKRAMNECIIYSLYTEPSIREYSYLLTEKTRVAIRNA